MSNIRLERMNHLYQEEISRILMREIKDEELKFVTITGVDITSDYSFAKVYYTVLDESKKERVHESFKKASPFIRTKLAEKVDLRHTPSLIFQYDESISYGRHIDEIIDEIHKK